MKEHILFDLDGTLTDSLPGITRAVQYALLRYGISVDDLETLRPFAGPPLQDSFREFYQFSEKDANDAVPVFREYYNIQGWAENSVFEGVRGMLETMKAAGRRLYVATSKPETMALRVLGHFDMLEYFDFVGGADEKGKREKKADVIRFVRESCGLADADSIVMVGDRRHDITGAHDAGIQAVGVLYGYGSREELAAAGADWIAETAKELEKLLLTL